MVINNKEMCLELRRACFSLVCKFLLAYLLAGRDGTVLRPLCWSGDVQ